MKYIKNISKYFNKSVDNITIKCYNIIKDKESEADRKWCYWKSRKSPNAERSKVLICYKIKKEKGLKGGKYERK